MKEIFELVTELSENVEEIRPVVKQAISAIGSFGPECYELVQKVCLGSVDLRAEMVKRFEYHGFTRQESISLVTSQWDYFAKNMISKSLKAGGGTAQP